MSKFADCLHEQLDFTGAWWMPTLPEERVRGRLVGSIADWFALTTEGQLRLSPELPHGKHVLWGEDRTGHLITLLWCYEQSHKRSYRTDGTHVSNCKYASQVVLTEAHFEDAESVPFNRVSFGLTGLADWRSGPQYLLGTSGI
jgi:hypothetical protein